MSYDLNDLHRLKLSFKKAEYCESSCTECIYVPSYINWAIYIFRFDLFYSSTVLCHDHFLFFVPKC